MTDFTRLTNAIESGNYRAIQAECKRLRDSEGAAVWWSLTCAKADMIAYAQEMIEQSELAAEAEERERVHAYPTRQERRAKRAEVQQVSDMSYRELQSALKALRKAHPDHLAFKGLKLNAKKAILSKAYDMFSGEQPLSEEQEPEAPMYVSDYVEPVVEVLPPEVQAEAKAIIDDERMAIASYISTLEYSSDWDEIESMAMDWGEMYYLEQALEVVLR